MTKSFALFALVLAGSALPLVAHAATGSSSNEVVSAKEDGAISLNAPAETLKAADREVFRQDDEGLHVVTLPDGSQMVDLQGRFQMTTTAAVDADGHVHQGCTTAHEVAEHGIAVPQPKTHSDER